METWGVAANFVGQRPLRWGAKVVVQLDEGWGRRMRVYVRGLNFQGRTIETWVGIGDLRSFRPVMAGDGMYDTKAAAAVDAARLERCRRFWGAKCPLLTWRQHEAIAARG